MNSIAILGNIHKIVAIVQAHYGERGLLFSENLSMVTNTHFLFLDPFYVEGSYLNYHWIYHRYMQLHNPEAKMVVLGLWLLQHPNYIDIFHLPDSLEYRFSKAMAVREEWTLNLGGEDAREVLKGFFAGHGDKSLMSSLINLMPALNSSHYAVVHDNEDWKRVFKALIEPYSISGIEQFMQRWWKFRNIMENMPFYPELLGVKDSIEDIGLHLKSTDESKEWFMRSDVPSKLKSAVDTLRQIESEYVRNQAHER